MPKPVPGVIRAVAYYRVSDEDQRERATIEMQLDVVGRWAAEQGVQLVAEYKDDGVHSGLMLADRPDGARLLQDAPELRKRGVSLILMYRWDRLGRKPWVVWDAIHKLEETHGFRMKSVTQTADTSTPENVLLLCLDTGISNLERETLIKRSMDASEMLARRGAYLGGIVPYGYRVEGERREARLVIDEDPLPGLGLSTAEVIRTIFRMIADEKSTCYRVCVHLNALGVPTAYVRDGREIRKGQRQGKTAGTWTPGRVRNLVIATIYRGVYTYGKRTKRDREVIERECPAIVDEDTWHQAQAVLQSNITFKDRENHKQYLLRGLIRCGACGCNFVGVKHTSDSGRFYYVCGRKNRGRVGDGPRCPSRSVPWGIETEVWNDLERFLRDPGEALALCAARQRTQEETTEALAVRVHDLERRIESFGEQRARVIRWARSGMIGEEDLARQLRELDREERTVVQERDRCQQEILETATARAELGEAEAVLREIGRTLDGEVTWEQKRAVVEALVEGILVETREGEDGQQVGLVTVTYRFGATNTPTLSRRGTDSWLLRRCTGPGR